MKEIMERHYITYFEKSIEIEVGFIAIYIAWWSFVAHV